MLKAIITIALQSLFINEVYSSQSSFFDSITNYIGEENLKSNLFLPDGENIISDITPDIFIKKDVALNCLGIPVNLFANLVEQLFTQTTKAEDVRFYFYSRDQLQNVTVHASENFKLKKINYQINRNTVIIVHGFMSSGQQEWVENMKNAFLELDDVNVIVVDWQSGSNTWNYYAASISTRIVGSQIAKLFGELRQKALKTSPKVENFGSLHFVGHSLGAHISAHAAYLIKSDQENIEKKWTVGRITGLDPAQPCFSSADPMLKLDRSDAPIVDVIHTNARHILLLGLGLPDQLGHMDFYPNGGKVQLGCADINISFWNFLLLPRNVIRTAICSHGRSHEYFTDSILVRLSGQCKYVGHKWNRKYENITALLNENCDENDCPEMGINSINYHPDMDGIFFVPTGDTTPFCNVTAENKEAIEVQLNHEEFIDNNVINGFVDKIPVVG